MADITSGAERLMGMSDRTWARHANPWSVWTRVPIAPLLVLAIYARQWVGWEWSAVAVGVLLVWTFVNPRIFPAPKRLDPWSSRGVMGERLYLARKERPIPSHHLGIARLLTAVSALGVVPTTYGLVVLDPWAAAFGTTLIAGAKLWFVDRMAWLYDEISAADGAVPGKS